MSGIGRQTSAEEIAARVSQALERAGIVATLSGGGAVSIYSHNEYESSDLDFITTARNDAIAPARWAYGLPRERSPARRRRDTVATVHTLSSP